MNITQGFIFIMGLLAACLLSAYRVSQSQATVGNFVTLLTYMAQLQAPLNFLGMYYRSIQSTLVDAERMLELFTQEPTIKDKPNAVDLVVNEGEIRFDHVNFSYDIRREALKDMTFRAPPGRTVALVGESGGGKSTVLRLLFRFYDVNSGSIAIDGQDLRDVKLASLRKNIGIVPQVIPLNSILTTGYRSLQRNNHVQHSIRKTKRHRRRSVSSLQANN
jgi:ABC-type transport system involved in Fe-S cluster assembly fused permease/ATPase subunit